MNDDIMLIEIEDPFKLEPGDYKSYVTIGNVKLANTKHFNWFQKLMMKLCFGFVVTDIKKGESNDHINC